MDELINAFNEKGVRKIRDPNGILMKVSVILGTRPEAIKLVPVILALRNDPMLHCHICVTAQHRQMMDQVLDIFDIKPDTDLNLMSTNQTLAGFTARAIDQIDKYLEAEKPQLVLLQGDTNTVLSASIASFYRKIPVGNVEAGLRTWNLQSPWPEEANRVLTTRLATLHFAPTRINKQNLLREGVANDRIIVTGNTVIDALFLALEKIKQHPVPIPGLQKDQLETFNLAPLVLITGHRRESFGQGFDQICQAIAELAQRFPGTNFVYPVHCNPNVRESVQRILGKRLPRGHCIRKAASSRRSRSYLPNIHLIDPLPYLSFVSLMHRATIILTDSGGIQEEAPSLGKPVLVMRDTTERPEAVQAGVVKLVGAKRAMIVDAVAQLLTNSSARQKMSQVMNPYGDGRAANRILRACHQYLTSKSRPAKR